MRLVRGAAQRPGALVIGGDYRGLGVVRSLGRHGIPVWVLTDEHMIASKSRYATRSLPWPAQRETDQLEYLLGLCAEHRLAGWMLFPTGDEAAALVARHHKTLAESFRVTTPPWELMRRAYDKRQTYRLAAELGMPYPWTRYPHNREEVAALDCVFPLILKPAFKSEPNRFTNDKAWLVNSREELLARYDEALQFVDPDIVMIQELIPGGGEDQFSYGALCNDGRVVASSVARRWRQYPLDFGRSSSYVETVELPAVEELSRRLLAAIRFTGLIEVEFKRDPRDGCFKLLDLNARIWGWHTLGARAGVDFPWLLWRMTMGERLGEVRARAGVRWVRMVTDLPAVVKQMRRGILSPAAYLRSLRRPIEFAIFSASDPMPGILEMPILLMLAIKRRLYTSEGRHSPAEQTVHLKQSG